LLSFVIGTIGAVLPVAAVKMPLTRSTVPAGDLGASFEHPAAPAGTPEPKNESTGPE